ncbi:hypothetical protein BV898_08414 [Hypsibius exemplaris]|uniref:C2H2-type domain-containing protein n=1 Tax=Hypsibius exemplaris TaxID=2072580 RepID=A0A1W0WQJ8_HYPEX|nr:hypothetical protein BV898_08414 [Hypsibius exemplaris]
MMMAQQRVSGGGGRKKAPTVRESLSQFNLLTKREEVPGDVDEDDDGDGDVLMDEESSLTGSLDGRGYNNHEEPYPEEESPLDSAPLEDDGTEEEEDGYTSGILDFSTVVQNGGGQSVGRKLAGSARSSVNGEQSFDENGVGAEEGDEVNNVDGNGSLDTGSKSGGRGGKNIECDICKKTFSNAANMRRHRMRHSGIKPFKCHFCGNEFYRKDHMREHIEHKHSSSQVQCYFCQQVFAQKKDLFQHVTRDHDVDPRELHCHRCSFSAGTLGRYLWHLSTSHPRQESAHGKSSSPAPWDAGITTSLTTSDLLSHKKAMKPKRKPRKREAIASPPPPSMMSGDLSTGRYSASWLRPDVNVDLDDHDHDDNIPISQADTTTRYVSILPKNAVPPPMATLAQRLNGNHISSFAVPAGLSTVLTRPAGGASRTVESLSPMPELDVNGKTASGSSSNRRKSKAPVRVERNTDAGEEGRSSLVGQRIDGSVVDDVKPFPALVRRNNLPEDLFSAHSSTANGQGSQRSNGHHTRNLSTPAVSEPERETSPAKCPHCLILYPDRVLYMLHKTLHTDGHPYRCSRCRLQFPNRYEFYAHIVNHGGSASSLL